MSFNAIYNQNSFYEIFKADLTSAKTSIIIVSPFTSKIRLLKFMPLFKSIMENKIELTIVTRPKENFSGKEALTFDDKIQALRNLGAKVIFKSMIHQKFAIIDYNIVWYGSINLLSYGRSKESVIRLEDSNVASELYEIVY